MIKRKIFYITLTALLINCSICAQVQAPGLHSTFHPIKKAQTTFQEGSSVFANGLNRSFFIPTTFYSSQNNILTPPELTFESDGIIWAHYQGDTSFIIEDPEFTEAKYNLNARNSYILDNSIFSIYSAGLRQGTYMSKRSLIDGQLEWDYATNLSNNDKIELDFSLHQREDGNIETYGFRLLNNNVISNIVLATGVINRKVFDASNGELLSQHFTEFDDGGAYCPNLSGGFGSTFVIEEDKKYFTNCSWGGRRLTVTSGNDGEGLMTDSIGTSGGLLDSDIAPQTRYTGAKRLPSGNIAVPVSQFNEIFTLDEIITEVLILNPEGEMIRRIDITEVMDFTTYLSMEVVGDKILLYGTSFQDLVDAEFIIHSNIAIINESGEVFTQINNIEDYVNVRPALLPSGELLVVARDAENNCGKILKESDGKLEEVESLCHTDNDWYLSFNELDIMDNQLIITGNIIRDTMTFNQMGQLSRDGIPVAPLLLSFDLNKLDTGPVSVKKNKSVEEDLFRVSPNPVVDYIRTKFRTPQSGRLALFNQLGAMVKEIKILELSECTIQTDELGVGLYYLRFENENTISTQKVVIAK